MNIVTHSGSFHTDDIFAVATLLLKYPEAEVIRSRDKNLIAGADIVVDVGLVHDPDRKQFDHHQAGGAGTRPNGIPYASFGLVWKEYGVELAGNKEAADLLDEKLVMSIDAPDNGISVYEQVFENVRPYTISDFLYSYLKNETHDDEELYKIFMNLVNIARELLIREIGKVRERVEGMKKVEVIFESAPNKQIIVLEDSLPWEPVLVGKPEPIYVVYKRREGNWGAKGVPQTIKGFERKKLFPESWSALDGNSLKEVTGVEDAVFCHRGRFLCVAESKEGAVKLAELALNS